MKNKVKRQKADSRGEVRLALSVCDCGCGLTDWLDVRHQQKYIKGHGGKALLERRKAALCFAVEVKLIALGYGVLTAAKTALLALQKYWQRARDEMQKYGYSYLEMCWKVS